MDRNRFRQAIAKRKHQPGLDLIYVNDKTVFMPPQPPAQIEVTTSYQKGMLNLSDFEIKASQKSVKSGKNTFL